MALIPPSECLFPTKYPPTLPDMCFISPPSLKESIDKINNSLADKISKLNEEQVKVLNLFAENDESSINNYYTTLIESTQGMVEETINKSGDIIVVKKLLEVRTKLNEMKNEKPSLETIDNIIDLKKSFE